MATTIYPNMSLKPETKRRIKALAQRMGWTMADAVDVISRIPQIERIDDEALLAIRREQAADAA